MTSPLLSDQAKRFLSGFSTERSGEPPSLAQWRRDWVERSQQQPLPAGVTVSTTGAGGIASEWLDVPGADPHRVFLLIHGGGFNSGSPVTHRKFATLLGMAGTMRVLTPDYRLAPEHPFPSGVEDVLRAYRWLIGEAGYEPKNIVVGGDSAGGGMALSMLLMLRAEGGAMPRAVVLLSPWTDLTVSSPSYTDPHRRDPMVDRERSRQTALMYAGETDPADPLASPLFADLRGLPPMLVHVGGDEAMLDDSRLLAERAAAAGADVTYKAWPGLWHCFHHESPEIPEAEVAMAEIAQYLRRTMAG